MLTPRPHVTSGSDLGDSKSTQRVISSSSTQTHSQRKRDLFVKILQQEFIRELQYLWDVANGRAAPRDTFTSQLVSQLKSVGSYIPVPGIEAIVEKLGSVVEHSVNRERDKRIGVIANLMDELDLGRLHVLLEIVAREALRRYESFIIDRLSDVPEEGVIPFAKVGARRMLEKLSRTDKQPLAQGIGVGLSEATLLAGLIEGRSGSFVEGWSNHKVKLNDRHTKEKMFRSKRMNREVEIEDVYARPGFRDFSIREGKQIDDLYVRHKKGWHQEQPGWDKFVKSLKGQVNSLYNYGYVRFRGKKHKQDPKAGYMVMPQAVIRERYNYKLQERKDLSPALQTEMSNVSHSIVLIDRATIEAFLKCSAPHSSLSLRNYVRELHDKNKQIEWVACHESLEGLNFKGKDLSYCDLSGATLSGDLTGTCFSYSYLMGTVFKAVSTAHAAVFVCTKAAFLQAEEVDFTGADFTQADFSYAVFKGARLVDCKTLGTLWTQTDLRDIQVRDKLIQMAQAAQTAAHQQELDQQRLVLREVHEDIVKRTETLYELQQTLHQEVGSFVVREMKELEDKITQTLDSNLKTIEEKQQTQLHQLKNELQEMIQGSLAELKKGQVDPQAIYEGVDTRLSHAIHEARGEQEKALKGLQAALDTQRSQAEKDRKIIIELQAKMQGLVEEQNARESFEALCRQELKALSQQLEAAANKKEVLQLQSEIKALQSELEQLKQPARLMEALETFREEVSVQMSQLSAEVAGLKQKWLEGERRLRTEITAQLESQDRRISSLEQQVTVIYAKLEERLKQLESRVDVLENWAQDFKQSAQEMKLSQGTTTKVVADLQQDLQALLAHKQKEEQQQAIYRKQLQGLRSLIQTAASQTEIETLRVELEEVRKRLDERTLPAEIKQISRRFAELERNLLAVKKTAGQQRDQLQAVQAQTQEQIGQLEREYNRVTIWQQRWERSWETFLEEEKQERAQWQDMCEKAQQACDQRLHVLEGRVSVLEGWVKELRKNFDDIQVTPSPAHDTFRSRIESQLRTLEADVEALRKRDKEFVAEQKRYEASLKEYETRLALAQTDHDEKAMQALQAQVVALEQKLIERPAVLDRTVATQLQTLQEEYGQWRNQLQAQAKTNSQLRHQVQAVVERCVTSEQQLADIQAQVQVLFTQYARQCQEQRTVIQAKVDNLIRLRPEYTVFKKLSLLRDRVLNDPELVALSTRRMSLHGQSEPDAGAASDLMVWVDQTLIQSKDAEVGVIVGDAGCGKSTFFRQLEVECWRAVELKQPTLDQSATKDYIPLYIPLGLPWVQAHNVWSYLNQHAHYSIRFTAEEIFVLQRQYHVLLLADSYEQLREPCNLHDVNKISNHEGQVKLLISCRLGRFQELDEERWFMPKAERTRPVVRYRKRFVSPLNDEQIMQYLEHYVSNQSKNSETKSSTPSWGVREYQDYLFRHPELRELISHPSLLQVAIEVLPEFAAATAETGYSLTRKRLLEQFVNRWFMQKKQEIEASGRLPERGDIQRRFHQFCQEFAQGLERAGVMAVKYPFIEDPDDEAAYTPDSVHTEGPRGEWVKKLFGESKRALERDASPLKVSLRSEYQFLHPSLKDYFISVSQMTSTETVRSLPITPSRLPMPLPQPAVEVKSKIPARDKDPSFPIPAPVDVSATDSLSNVDAVLVLLQRRRLPYEQIQLLVDRVQEEPSFVQFLFRIIEESKQNPDRAIAAANAATLLNAAGVSFAERDWSGVRIAGADLSGGLLDGTNLSDAKLEGVNLQGAWLRGTNFARADLANLKLGEWPYLTANFPIIQTGYAPHGQWLVVACNRELRLFDTIEYRLVKQWEAHTHVLNQFVFHPAGTQLVTAGADQTIRVWDLESGSLSPPLLHSFTQTSPLLRTPGSVSDAEDEDAIDQQSWPLSVSNSVVYHPTQRMIASGGLDGQVEIRNLADAKVEKKLTASESKGAKPGGQQINAMAWETSGRYLAAGHINRDVSLWDLQSGQVQTLRGHTNTVDAVSFHPQGRYLVTGGLDKTLQAWDITTAQRVREFKGHRGAVTGISFEGNGERFVTSSDDKTVVLWEFNSGHVLRQWRGHTEAIKSVSFHPQGHHIASGGMDKTVRIWEAATHRELRGGKGHRQEVECLALDAQSSCLYSGSSDGAIRLWDREGRMRGSLNLPLVRVTGLALDPTRNRLYASSWDRSIRVWDMKTQQAITEYKGLSTLVNHIALDAQGERLAWGGLDGKVRLCEATTGKILQEYKGPVAQIHHLAFDSNGEYLAVASEDSELFVWNTQTHQRIILRGHEQGINDACFIPGQPWLISASWDNSLRLWDLRVPGEAVRVYQGHTQPVIAATTDPSGKYLLSASDDQTLRLWDIHQEKSLGTWPLPYPAKTLVWHSDLQGHQLFIGAGALVTCFTLKVIDDQFTLKLAWQAGTPSLFASGACIDRAQHLSPHYARLFSQRGAVGTPAEVKTLEAKGSVSFSQGDSKGIADQRGDGRTNLTNVQGLATHATQLGLLAPSAASTAPGFIHTASRARPKSPS